MNSLSEYFKDPPSLIAVMGVSGSGKSMFVNKATNSRLSVGEDLESCTPDIQLSEEIVLDGQRVVLIDTPGFDDDRMTDSDVLKSIALFLGAAHSAQVKLTGVIYVHRISDVRFGGSAIRNFQMLRELCGEKTLKNVALVTSMWGKVSPELGASRERQLKSKFFKVAIDNGAQMHRHDGTAESALEIIRNILKNQPAVLKIQEELIDERKEIGETAAGAELNREIQKVIEKYRKEVKELEESMRRAMRERDEESRRELEEEKRRNEEKMVKLRQESEEMRITYEESQRKMEEKMNAQEAKIDNLTERVENMRSGCEIM